MIEDRGKLVFDHPEVTDTRCLYGCPLFVEKTLTLSPRALPLLFCILALVVCLANWSCGIGDQPCQPTLPPEACGDNEVAVQAIMDAHCASCHGQTPVAGAPGGFRLDIYDGSGSGERGTLQMLDRVVARSLDGTMPPAGLPALTSEQLETLEAWSSCQCSAQTE